MSHWQGRPYVAAVLVPLLAFVVERLGGRRLGHRNAYLATGAIGVSFALSLLGFVLYMVASGGMPTSPGDRQDEARLVSRVPIAADLRALRDDPMATVRGWLKGQRRQVWDRGVSFKSDHSGSTTYIEASRLEMVRPMFGGSASVSALAFGPVAVRQTLPEGEGADHGPVAWTGRLDLVELAGGLAPPLRIPIGIRIDGLAVLMFLMVTGVALVVHLHAIESMRGDPQYPRFFAYLSLFCFAMLGLVASANLFWVFVCWELVGLCSYLLIGFWSDRESNTDAAIKAFVTNRVGDVGLLIGLGLIWAYLGTFDIAAINRTLRDDAGHLHTIQADDGTTLVERRETVFDAPVINRATRKPYRMPMWALTLAGLGVFASCMGKSAQFPLHVWLPDAMAAPTPVSALIHAATMVVAGVYLAARLYGLFTADVLLAIAYVGGVTMLLGATVAVVQTDCKKVLAYSTMSQLGLMMLGLGVGGWSSGLFHLLTHAGPKALLFLGAGNVYHAVQTYEMTEMGGLYPRMKTTARTMLLATMAIVGVPILSGFYSKDAVLAAAFDFARRHPEHQALIIIPVVGSLLTAFYMFRMWFLIFTGPARGERVEQAHECPRPMTRPLLLLAVPTVVAGWPLLIVPFSGEPVLEGWLRYGEPAGGADFSSEHFRAFAASLIVAALGIGLGLVSYGPVRTLRWVNPARVASIFWPVHALLRHKFYLDEVYCLILVRPVMGLARLVAAFDWVVIDGLVDGLARGTVRLCRWERAFDLAVVDGLVRLFARTLYVIGDQARWLQTGRLRTYLLLLGAAVVVLGVGLILWVQG
jgi:proton-translocating NADH-quinone oxidoreductase chain L